MRPKTKAVLVLGIGMAIIGTTLAYAGMGKMGLRGNLNEEQRAAVRAKISEMSKAGASREEIRGALREMLAGYGIDLRERFRGCPGERVGRGENLNEEQRSAVRAKISEMREAGASREEIRGALREMLAGYGIDLRHSSGAGAMSSSACRSEAGSSEPVSWGGVKAEFR